MRISLYGPRTYRGDRHFSDSPCDGGYRNELRPADVKPEHSNVAKLPALPDPPAIDKPWSRMPGRPWLASANEWTARDGGLWAKPKSGSDQPSSLRTPLNIGDGSIECELKLNNDEATIQVNGQTCIEVFKKVTPLKSAFRQTATLESAMFSGRRCRGAQRAK